MCIRDRLRTDRGKKVSWKEKEFWDNSPWVTEDGGEWIKNYAPKVVGYDFPQDYVIRIREPKPGQDMRQPVHELSLIHIYNHFHPDENRGGHNCYGISSLVY